MTEPVFELTALVDRLAICKLDPRAPMPAWLPIHGFASIVRTADELTIVCPAAAVPDEVRRDAHWRAFKVEGPFDFAVTGVDRKSVV